MKKVILFIPVFISLFFYTACQKENQADLCIAVPQEDCICTEEYAPVCGCDDVTYGNSCEAECNGIFDYTTGPCN